MLFSKADSRNSASRTILPRKCRGLSRYASKRDIPNPACIKDIITRLCEEVRRNFFPYCGNITWPSLPIGELETGNLLAPYVNHHSSPAAGGLFSDIANASIRWSDNVSSHPYLDSSSPNKNKQNKNPIGKLYNTLYGNLSLQTLTATVRNAVQKHNISGHAAAMRWTAFHSSLDEKYGDGVIFGVSKIEQLHKNLDALEAGPLPDEVAEAITAIYATIEGSEPPYHL